MTVILKFYWLSYFFLVACVFLVSLLYAQDSLKSVKVIRPLSFGNITYQGDNPVFTIAHNSLHSLNGNIRYTASGAYLGEVQIYGEANEVVNLNFYSVQGLVDNDLGAYITNISTSDMSNTITLDNAGKATVEITATIKLNDRGLNNELGGKIRIVVNYTKDNTVITEDLPWTVKPLGIGFQIISQLNFGKVVSRTDRDCNVTVYANGSPATSDCLSFSGEGATPILVHFTGLLSPVFDLLLVTIPSSNVYLQSSNGKFIVINNFSVKKKWHFEILNGYGELTVGATLHIPANSSGKLYFGNFDVSWLFG